MNVLFNLCLLKWGNVLIRVAPTATREMDVKSIGKITDNKI